MTEPLVSILIPVYNREALVPRAIESALRQTYGNVEIVAVDNSSEDGTWEVLQRYCAADSRIRISRNTENIGATRNWLRCLALSNGAYIKLLFSDDWLSPTAVGRLLVALESAPSAGASYSAVAYHNDSVPGFPRYEEANSLGSDQLVPSAEFLRAFLNGSISLPRSPGQALFRRKDFEQWLMPDDHNRLGLRCSDYGMGNDCLLYLRACARYPYMAHVAEPLAHYQIHEGSITIADTRTRMAELCIWSAMAHFLAETQLPPHLARELRALLWVRFLFSDTRDNLPPWRLPSASRRFRLLFPSDRDASPPYPSAAACRLAIAQLWRHCRNRVRRACSALSMGARRPRDIS